MITKTSLSTTLILGLIAVFAVMLFLPVDAFAQAGGVGGNTVDITKQTSQLSKQLVNVPKLIALGSYVIGAFFAVRALFALKGFIESPDDNPLTKVLGFAAVSALLILLPYIINVMTTTITKNTNVSNLKSSSQSFTDDGNLGS